MSYNPEITILVLGQGLAFEATLLAMVVAPKGSPPARRCSIVNAYEVERLSRWSALQLRLERAPNDCAQSANISCVTSKVDCDVHTALTSFVRC